MLHANRKCYAYTNVQIVFIQVSFPNGNFSISFGFIPIQIAQILFDFNLVTFWLKARLTVILYITSKHIYSERLLCRHLLEALSKFCKLAAAAALIAINCRRAINAATHSNNEKLPNIYISLYECISFINPSKEERIFRHCRTNFHSFEFKQYKIIKHGFEKRIQQNNQNINNIVYARTPREAMHSKRQFRQNRKIIKIASQTMSRQKHRNI